MPRTQLQVRVSEIEKHEAPDTLNLERSDKTMVKRHINDKHYLSTAFFCTQCEKILKQMPNKRHFKKQNHSKPAQLFTHELEQGGVTLSIRTTLENLSLEIKEKIFGLAKKADPSLEGRTMVKFVISEPIIKAQ